MMSIAADSRSTEPEGVELSAVARGGLATLAGALVSAVANFGLVFVVARFVSTSDAGRFFTVTSLFLMLESVGRLGADIGLIYFIARWRALRSEVRIRSGLRVAFVPAGGLAMVLALVMAGGAPWIARLIGVDRGSSVELIRLLALVLPLAVAYNICLGATRGFGRMRPTVLVEKMLRPMAQLILVAAVLAVDWDTGLGYAWALPYLVGFVLAGYLLRTAVVRHTAPAGLRRAWDGAVAKEFWSFTLPRSIASVAQLALQRLDIILVASIRGPREAAIYTAATRFLVVGQFINQAITAPLQPRLSAALSTGATRSAHDLYRASTTWLVLACWPLFGVAAVFAPVYVRFFGEGYRSGAIVVVLLSIAMLFASAVGLVDTVIIMAGRTAWNLATTMLALVVNVGVDLALIPHYGLVGAAIGWCCSIVTANMVPLIIVWRRLNMHPFGRSTFTAYGLCFVSYVLIPSIAYFGAGESQVGALVGVVLGTALYYLGLRRWAALFNLTGLLHRRVPAV